MGPLSTKGGRSFMGAGALTSGKAPALVRRCFALKGNPKAQGSEPILSAGKVIGITTSGAQVPWLGRTVVMGYVPAKDAEEVEIEVERYALTPHAGG
jgi:glycine cleavage system aminomethyltransferase T